MSRRRLVAIAALAILASVLGGLLALRHAPRWLDVGRLEHPARWALVLGGSPVDRATAAATLERSGWVEGVLLTRVRREPDVEEVLRPTQEHVARELLLGLGVPPERILLLPGEVDSTFDEALVLGRFLDLVPADVIVVTEDYHTRRARFVFRRVLGRDVRLQFVGCPSSDTTLAPGWWRDPDSAHHVVSELIKSAVYRLRF